MEIILPLFICDEAEQNIKINDISARLEAAQKNALEIAERIATNNDKVTAIKNENADLNAQHDKIVQNYHREKSRLESLINITERYDGYGNSIRKIMELKDSNSGILGVIADIVKVEMNVRRNAAMKQTLAMLFVTALLLFSLAGCGEKKDSNTANGPSTGTTDNGAADSGKKDDNMPGDDMSGENKKDDSVTGDGMMGDDMDGDGENATRSVDRRNAAASASDRSRYFGSDKTITHKNGNLYGKTYLNPETEKSANAQLRSNGRSLTGITNDELYSYDLRYRQMLSNGRVHDTDGFLFDGENTHYNTLK